MSKLLTNETVLKIEAELKNDEYLHIDADTDNKYEIEYLKAYAVTVYVMKDSGEVRAKFNSYMECNMYANFVNGEVLEYV